MRALGTCVVVCLAATAFAPVARAEGAADALFRDGTALLAQRRYAEACDKLAASQALEDADGTLLALAMCREGEGRVVDAWRAFVESEARAEKADRPARLRLSRAGRERTSRRVARARVVLDADRPCDPACVVSVDGGPRGDADDLVLDPGRHRVEVWQGERLVASRAVELDAGTSRDVRVAVSSTPPASEPVPEPATEARPVRARPAPAPAQAASRASSSGDVRTRLGIALGALAATGLGAGTYFGLRAGAAWSAVEDKCDPRACRDRSAIDDRREAKQLATASNVAFGVGAAAGVGALWLLFAPRGASERTVVAPAVSARGAEISLSGRF